MKDTYKSYFKNKIINPSIDKDYSSACETTPSPSPDILSIYNVKDYNGNYDYSKVSKKIVDAVTASTPQSSDTNIKDMLLQKNILLSCPWTTNPIIDEKVTKDTTYSENIEITEINDVFEKLKKSIKAIVTTDYDNIDNWYDFFTIPDYNIGNKYSRNQTKIFHYCALGYIPSLDDEKDDKMIERNIAKNGSYKNMFFYSPLALILLLGTSKSDLLYLYDKDIQKKWNDEYEKVYNYESKIKYDLIINSDTTIKDNKDSYINNIFNEKNEFIKKLFNKYAYNLTYKNIEPLYDKYSNNIYEKDISILFYEKAYEIALKVSKYQDDNEDDKFFVSMQQIHTTESLDTINNIIDIIRISSYYCFGKITEKNSNLNRIYQNYNNYCLNKLNSNYTNTNEPVKSNIDIDISRLSDKNIKRRKQNNIINSIKEYKIDIDNLPKAISSLSSKILLVNDLEYDLKNSTFKINLLNNSFFRTIQSYIKFFIFFVVTNLIIYLSYYLIENNWNSFINVFDTLIFGLIIIIGSIIDYGRNIIFKIPFTKRNVLYIHKTSLNLEYEINSLKRKYANFKNSKENKGGDMIENIILGLAFLFIIKIIIQVIIDVSKLFKKSLNKNINPYYHNSDENIEKIYEYNDNKWWNYKVDNKNDLIDEIKLELIYLQFKKLENLYTTLLSPNGGLTLLVLTFLIKFQIEFSNLLDKNSKVIIYFKLEETNKETNDLSNPKYKNIIKKYKKWKKYDEEFTNVYDNIFINMSAENKTIINNIINNINNIFLITQQNYRDFVKISNKINQEKNNRPTFLEADYYKTDGEKITFTTKNYELFESL